MRILVVEDEIHLAEALAQILKKNNYTVDVSNDGEDGLDNALSGIYDVIVLDIMLPKMNGLDVLENIRSEGFDTPVILLTAKIRFAVLTAARTITLQSRLIRRNCWRVYARSAGAAARLWRTQTQSPLPI